MMWAFTPGQMLAFAVGACGIVKALYDAVSAVAAFILRLRRPQMAQDDRLDEHEKWLTQIDKKLNRYDELFANDKAAIDSINECDYHMTVSVMALLSHSIYGNNDEQMRDALDGVNKYLAERKGAYHGEQKA